MRLPQRFRGTSAFALLAVAGAFGLTGLGAAQACDVNITWTLTNDTISGNNKIANDIKNTCPGGIITWTIENTSDQEVKLTLEQFHQENYPGKKRDPLTFMGGRSKTLDPDETKEIKARVKPSGHPAFPDCVKYFVKLETDVLTTSHDPRLEIADPPPPAPQPTAPPKGKGVGPMTGTPCQT